MATMRTTIVLIIMFACMQTVFGQSSNGLKDGFTASYTHETNKDYASAIAVLTKVYDAKSYETNLRLGWLHYLNKQYNESVSYYEKAVKLMPAATEPLWGLVNPYFAKEDWMNLEQTYLAIIKFDQKNSTANYRLGLIYYYRKNFTTAKKHFDVVLNLYPFDYDALLMSAWTSYALGKFNEAKVLFNKVLLSSPNNTSALEGLGLIK